MRSQSENIPTVQMFGNMFEISAWYSAAGATVHSEEQCITFRFITTPWHCLG